MLRVLSAPVLYALELTPACNNRCNGCLNVFTPKARAQEGNTVHPLGLTEWSSLLDRLAPHAQRFKLTGGEPTLHPQFAEILKRIDQLGVEFVVFTNGRWVDPPGLLDLLAEARWLRGILVSLHGAHSRSHDVFTGVEGSFKETVGNIERVTRRLIPVTISSVLTRHNLDEIEALTELAARLGAQHVVFNRYFGPATSPNMPDSDDLATAIKRIGDIRRQGHPVKFGNCIPQCFAPNDSSGCLAGVAYCAIDPWGNMRPCTHSSLVAGNLLRQKLEEVWLSSVMSTFRESIPPGCHRCEAFSTCHGGCKALGSADPFADLNKATSSLSQTKLSFHPALRPISLFTVRSEEWGLVLLRGNRVIPLSPAASPLLAMFDGKTSLADIEMRFGAQGLSLIGSLYQKGIISLV